MSHSTKMLSIVSTLLLISCATAPSGKTFDSPIGVWKERFATMSGSTRSGVVTITDKAKGSYTNPGGRLEFHSTDDRYTWKAYWILESGSRPCSTEKGGSKIWGEQIFQFNETYNQYTGTWDSCGEGPKYSIKGVR